MSWLLIFSKLFHNVSPFYQLWLKSLPTSWIYYGIFIHYSYRYSYEYSLYFSMYINSLIILFHIGPACQWDIFMPNKFLLIRWYFIGINMEDSPPWFFDNFDDMWIHSETTTGCCSGGYFVGGMVSAFEPFEFLKELWWNFIPRKLDPCIRRAEILLCLLMVFHCIIYTWTFNY